MTTKRAKPVLSVVLALILAVGSACVAPVSTAHQDDPWVELKGQTAWIEAGQLDASTGESAILPAFTVVGKVGVGLPGDRRILTRGDILVVTHERPLYILGFKTSGESRRLEPLNGVSLDDRDLTGGVLKPGDRVVVQEVRRDTGAQCDTLCTVWARVSPEKRD